MKNIQFSAVFQPTTLFSLKDSNSTNSGAKSLFLPSPYTIRMAILNQAITWHGIDFEVGGKKNKAFQAVRDVQIEYAVRGKFCVNNCFVKILRKKEDKRGKKAKEAGAVFIPGMQETVSFREYIQLSEPIEIIFTGQTEEDVLFLKKYIYKINYFGKRGCFFQFEKYKSQPSESNVQLFQADKLSAGIFQEYDDFSENFIFDQVNNYNDKRVTRSKKVLILPLERQQSSKSYTTYQVF